ncbi:MAG: hypothetical protein FJ026_17395, partial [Chloroflexi bacterium]|nr:hypothetical protein [Chloroflexota bacterium]
DGNNTGASTDTIAVDVASLTLGVPASGTLGTGEARFYRVDVPAGETLLVSLDSASADAANELYVRYGQVPSRGNFDYGFSAPLQPDQEVVVPSTVSGTYYILLYGASVPGGAQTFSLEASLLQFGLRSIEPMQGGQGGEVTVRLNGALMSLNVTAMLDNGAKQIAASAIYWFDASVAYGTFDLTNAPLGAYDVCLADNGRTATLASAFTVVTGIPGEVRVQLSVPSALRPGQQGTLTVDYFNHGNTDTPAPLLRVSAENADLKLPEHADFAGSRVQFLAINTAGPAGILPPGANGRMSVFFRPTVSTGEANFSVYTLVQPTGNISGANLLSRTAVEVSVARDNGDRHPVQASGQGSHSEGKVSGAMTGSQEPRHLESVVRQAQSQVLGKAGIQDQSASGGWQMYIDRAFGFSIQYPPGWEGRWMFDHNHGEEYVIRRRVAFFSPKGAEVDVDVWDNRNVVAIEDWLEKYREFLVVDVADDDVLPKHQVAGFPAARFLRIPGKQYPSIASAYLTNGKFVFRVAYSAFDMGIAMDLYDQMLASLAVKDAVSPTTVESNLPGPGLLTQEPAGMRLMGDSSCYGYTNFRTSRWACQ